MSGAQRVGAGFTTQAGLWFLKKLKFCLITAKRATA
jgi:hypothetical protein